MKFAVHIDIMPHKELLDPQGKTVANNMKYLNITGVDDIRIGKHIQIVLDAPNEADARAKIDLACQKLLANMIMETYTFTVEPMA